MKPILNYTTTISVDKTIGEIQKELSQCDNIQVLTSYDGGVPTSISFRIETVHGTLSFLLPAKVEKVYEILIKSSAPKSLRTREQAARVAWRVIKDWIEAQVALVKADLVKMEEVFMPFLQDENGKTLYSVLESKGFKGLSLPPPEG